MAGVTQSFERVEAAAVAESRPETPPQCDRLTDFEASDENESWSVVNDNIMGGRSLGGPEFDGAVMTFSGYINTNGGGFSSVRKPLDPSILEPYSRVVLRLKPDGRAYRLIMEDALEARSAPTVHRKNIEFGPAGEWQIVSVAFDQLQPSVFGNPVEAPPFRKDLASRIGLMLNDVGDGPFELEVDWIDLCP
ncbi:MAG: CIA30 family protein [Cyanobacteria bacterium P01_A01_bin.135]